MPASACRVYRPADRDDSYTNLAPKFSALYRLRPDAVTESVNRDLYQQNASSVAGGLYLVPKVIE